MSGGAITRHDDAIVFHRRSIAQSGCAAAAVDFLKQ